MAFRECRDWRWWLMPFMTGNMVFAEKARKTMTYTTWGKKKCAGKGATTLYSGWMGNTIYYFHGSGHNYLCMHPQGQKGTGSNAGRQNGAWINHVDYAKSMISSGGGPGSKQMAKLNGQDASCSVCEVEAPGRSCSSSSRSILA